MKPCKKSGRAKNKDGYGIMNKKTYGFKLEHRYIWYKHYGPDSLVSTERILHICDNPGCIEITHLTLGTQTDNIKDMDNKNRRSSAFGINNGNSVLDFEDVLEIRHKYKTGNYTQKELGRIFNTSSSNIQAIVNYKTRKLA